MEARPRVVNFGLEALDGVDSKEFHRRPPVEVCELNEGCIQGRNASCLRRDHRRETPTKRGAGRTRLGVVLPHSQVAAFPASARRCRPHRLSRFASREWLSLLAESSKLCETAKDASVRKRRRGAPTDEARRALEGAVVAPGTFATLTELTNPVRRPPRPRDPVPPEILGLEPE